MRYSASASAAASLALIGLTLACRAPASAPKPSPTTLVTPPTLGKNCRADVPADLTGTPATWLGGCIAGAANGMGVTRAGSAAPYGFFAGQMHAGRLVNGVIVLPSGLMKVAVRFDANRRAVVSDGLKPAEDEEVFRTATAAAISVSQRFAAAGNRASAAYYAKLAARIKAAPPE